MKLVKVLALAFLSVLITIIVLSWSLITATVSANPNKCPDGHTCWCGKNKAGKIQLMVDQAVANGWIEVDMSLCVPDEPVMTSSTPFQPKKPTDAPVEPSRTSVATIQPSATYLPKLPTKIALTPGFCDSCSAQQQSANALSTIAAAQATTVIHLLTREPVP